MRKFSKRKTSKDVGIRGSPAGDAWHYDIMTYLGSMNASLGVLALLRLYTLLKPSSSKLLTTGSAQGDLPLDFVALVVLGAAHLSQAFVNFTIGSRADRWILGKGFDRITVIDAVFTILDLSTAYRLATS